MLTYGAVHAVYGLLFPLACRPDIFLHFLNQLGL